MASSVPGLYAAGELAGGANGANRLSGNALPEAVVFGERAGEKAAQFAARCKTLKWDDKAAQRHLDLIRRDSSGHNAGGGISPGQLMGEIKKLMWEKVGAFRNGRDLGEARDRLRTMRRIGLDDLTISPQSTYNTSLVEWFELRNGLFAADRGDRRARRAESRGAHQRDDFPKAEERFLANQRLSLVDERAHLDLPEGSRVSALHKNTLARSDPRDFGFWRGTDRDHGRYDEFDVAFEDGSKFWTASCASGSRMIPIWQYGSAALSTPMSAKSARC